MRITPVLAFALLAIVRCGNTSEGPCTLTAIGAQCTQDTDCCSAYCQLYDTASYCQAKPSTQPACVPATGFCTQNRNCCSGLCENGACFGGLPVTSCLSDGSLCIDDSSCCSNNCYDTGTTKACAPPPLSDGGYNCQLPGGGCAQPSDCCLGDCQSDGTCGTPASGGGGPNCGGSGSFCKYGSDCCTGICEQLSSTSSCK